MDLLISDGSERFLTKVGRFGSEFGSVRNPEKPRFGSENIENSQTSLLFEVFSADAIVFTLTEMASHPAALEI
jgi:hypothetical protein